MAWMSVSERGPFRRTAIAFAPSPKTATAAPTTVVLAKPFDPLSLPGEVADHVGWNR